MRTTSLNAGCGLISTAPVFAAHLIFAKKMRYVVLTWFCAFVSTVLLVICSLSSLFTNDPFLILLFSIPIDCLGKIVIKFFACRINFLSSPIDRLSLGMCCGLGFALAHVLTLYLPVIFDQPYSIKFDTKHPDYFPNCLDLALSTQAVSVFHMGIGLFLFRFSEFNIILMYLIILTLQYVIGALTQIPIIWLKQILVNFAGYGCLLLGIYSFRTLRLSPIDSNLLQSHSD